MSKYYKAEDVHREYYDNGFDNFTRCDAEELYADLPTIEVSDDCISRQQAIEILCRSRCGVRARECPAHSCPIIEKYDNLPPKTQIKTQNSNLTFEKTEVSEDCISRLRDYQIEWLTAHCDIELEPILEQLIIRFLNDTTEMFSKEYAPSVVPSRAEGEWIDNHNGTYTCSECGNKHSKSKYCSECGAKMKG